VGRARAAEPVFENSLARESRQDLQIYVVFTDVAATKAAIRTAAALARELSARLVLLIAKIVPWPLPLETPPVSAEFTARMVSQIAGDQDDLTARVYLCRDPVAAIRNALEPGSLVVIGEKKHRLVRPLRQDGHEVILQKI
jgi:hypothetical protein